MRTWIFPAGAVIPTANRKPAGNILLDKIGTAKGNQGTKLPVMTGPVVAAIKRFFGEDDETAVVLCQKGEAEAFEILVERHQNRMLNIAYRMLGDYDEACDVVQEAFLSAYRSIRTFRREAKFSTWLYGIVVNQAKNRIRQTAHRSHHEARSMDDPAESADTGKPRYLIDGGESAMEVLEKREMEKKVQDCIGSLDGEYREVLVLRDIQGFSYDEIGTMLNLPDGTVKSRLFRARAALKDCLVTVLGEPL